MFSCQVVLDLSLSWNWEILPISIVFVGFSNNRKWCDSCCDTHWTHFRIKAKHSVYFVLYYISDHDNQRGGNYFRNHESIQTLMLIVTLIFQSFLTLWVKICSAVYCFLLHLQLRIRLTQDLFFLDLPHTIHTCTQKSTHAHTHTHTHTHTHRDTHTHIHTPAWSKPVCGASLQFCVAHPPSPLQGGSASSL